MMVPKGTIIVTGANGGLGSATVSQIVSSPRLSASYYGVYTVRNASTTPSLDAALVHSTSSNPHSHEKISLDLAQLSDIRKVAAEINQRIAAGTIPRIHAIILNAGYEEFQEQSWTEDGLDTAFATNYLGHWLLTVLLLQSMDHEVGRVLWISSWSHIFKEEKYNTIINSSSIDPIAKGTWSANKDDKTGWAAGYRRYGASKLCGVTMISELQRRLDQDSILKNVSVLGIDPGLVNTGIVRRSGSWFLRVFLWQYLLPAIAVILARLSPNGPIRLVGKSAKDIIATALKSEPSPLSARPKGLYFNGSELGKRNPEAKDPAKGALLWRDWLSYTRLKEGETCLEHWR
ncbi:putative short-chain dehydrogenase [Dendryphion nanum]|uniref:Short-chain dehydrogenase n=1 Tax=Dendryphion nanum TaxID=256645 RepID=A0A9P9D784_9PLEO|nr:putative short-chain dehydrogenase [Dendryphion nanum]